MTAFRFDAEAALKRAREGRDLPTLPTLPTREAGETRKVGRVGDVGTGRDLPHASAPDLRARLDAARARVAQLVDGDGIARTDAAIEAVWDEAEALAAVREAEGTPHRKV
ncbi:hypothetical protein [Rhodosalinus sediminis]|uniref:hypothetical protein n=1 Tax=Rhodosalinus sediminis TaxID=1940533 RepID=UPI002353D86F|nr:hypothetical protein [Rhodosalinus sediminis]